MTISESAKILSGSQWKPPGMAQQVARIKKVGLACTRWYTHVIQGLEASAREFLMESGVPAEKLVSVTVPGSFELPLAAQNLAQEGCDFVVALGCVVRGETPHFDYVCQGASWGLMKVQLEQKLPIGFGLLTVDTIHQAEARLQKGAEAAQAALAMWLQMHPVREGA